jgi:hypothetical protein
VVLRRHRFIGKSDNLQGKSQPQHGGLHRTCCCKRSAVCWRLSITSKQSHLQHASRLFAGQSELGHMDCWGWDSSSHLHRKAKPLNYTNSSTPTQSAVFYHTPANNGAFQIPAFPGTFPTEARIENGWISARNNNAPDHHLLTIDATTGNLQDMYQWYTADLNRSFTICKAA